MFYVYILRSKGLNKTYVGYTSTLQGRVFQHKSGYSSATQRVKDWELVYSEQYPTKILAIKREKYLKSGDGRKVLKLKGIIL